VAQAAYAYQQPARRLQEVKPSYRPQIREVPGRKTAGQTAARPRNMLLPALAVIISLLLMTATVAGLRVAIHAATLQTVVDSESISSEIADARAEGLRLEVEYSIATNPDRIQQMAAEQLGMGPDSQVDYLAPAYDG